MAKAATLEINDEVTEEKTENKSGLSEQFDKEYQARVKSALKDLSPKIITALEMFGIITETGYYLEHQALRFTYDELLGNLFVDFGGTAVLRANVITKRVTSYRTGNWLKIFDELYQRRVQGQDYSLAKQRSETRIRQQMGMSKI